ncbi:hypothetical protein JTB14_038465 [Gonioctena quinquepunctata]|nr:hypothetical protein JTB14_038465 [Gonioctena quinquepunctata]
MAKQTHLTDDELREILEDSDDDEWADVSDEESEDAEDHVSKDDDVEDVQNYSDSDVDVASSSENVEDSEDELLSETRERLLANNTRSYNSKAGMTASSCHTEEST